MKCSMFLSFFQTCWAKLCRLLTSLFGSPQLFSPTAIMLHLGPFFNLSQPQIPVSIRGFSCTVIRCDLCLTGLQILCSCVMSTIMLLIMDLELWSYYSFPVKFEMTAGNSTIAKQNIEEKVNFYVIICHFQDLCVSIKPKQHSNPKLHMLVTQDLLFKL